MKKAFLGILMIFLIFSIEDGYAKEKISIEELLDLKYGPIIYDLNLETLDVYNFKDEKLKSVYLTFINYDNLIRSEIIDRYKKGIYSDTTIKGIVRNYKNFVYFTNELFSLLKQVESYPHLRYDIDMQDGILSTYKNTYFYYKKVKSLVSKKN